MQNNMSTMSLVVLNKWDGGFNAKMKHHLTYPCILAIRDHERKAGPPKKSSRSDLLMLYLCKYVREDEVSITSKPFTIIKYELTQLLMIPAKKNTVTNGHIGVLRHQSNMS